MSATLESIINCDQSTPDTKAVLSKHEKYAPVEEARQVLSPPQEYIPTPTTSDTHSVSNFFEESPIIPITPPDQEQESSDIIEADL